MNNIQKVIIEKLYDGKRTGYELTKLFAKTTGNSHQQIYRELKALMRKGFISVEHVEQSGKPDKKVYTLINDSHNMEFEESRFEKTNAAYMLASVSDDLHKEYVEKLKEYEAKLISGLLDGFENEQ